MTYDFLADTYETERVKIISTWSEFRDEDMHRRPREGDPREVSTAAANPPDPSH